MTIPNELTSHLTPPPEPAAGAESLGAWLTQVRASYNAEQREVARHLGLNAAIIEALESDNFERLGPPVFVRGYLSRYARLLNLPEQAVLERYRRQAGTTHQEPPPLKVMHPLRRQTRVRDLRGVFYLMVVVAIAWAAIQNLDSLDPTRLWSRWSADAPSAPAAPERSPGSAISQTQYPFQQTPSEATTAAPATPAPAATVAAPAPKASEAPPVAAAPVTVEIAPPVASVSPARAGRRADAGPRSDGYGRHRAARCNRRPAGRRRGETAIGIQQRLLGGSERRPRQRPGERFDESRQHPDHFRPSPVQGHARQRPRHADQTRRPFGEHRFLRAPARHGQPFYSSARPTILIADAAIAPLGRWRRLFCNHWT
jgi:cytoskeletal protein RodZ